jgi:hypothetical protein
MFSASLQGILPLPLSRRGWRLSNVSRLTSTGIVSQIPHLSLIFKQLGETARVMVAGKAGTRDFRVDYELSVSAIPQLKGTKYIPVNGYSRRPRPGQPGCAFSTGAYLRGSLANLLPVSPHLPVNTMFPHHELKPPV